MRRSGAESRATLSDELIELAFSYYFTWGYPDYVREAFQILVARSNGTAKPLNPQKDLSWRELRVLLEEADSSRVRHIVAGNPNTPAAVLDFLSKVQDFSVVERVAENNRAHAATLARLALHEQVSVRLALCENTATPEAVLRQLTADSNPDVRYRLAESTLVPDSILEILSRDENPYVSGRAHRTLSSKSPAQVVAPDFSKVATRRLKRAAL